MNQKAIITGASKGIGCGIARKLAALGYDIAFSYASHKEEALSVREEIIRDHGVRCACYQAQLNIPGEGKKLFDQALAFLGGLDLMVNNAGVTYFEGLLDLTEEKMDYMLNLNFRNYVLMMRESALYMAKNGVKGCIVNITSSRSQQGYPEDGVYGGIKAGLNRAIESFALDVAPYGIRINNVAPGAIRIRKPEEIKDFGVDLPCDFWDVLGERIPLGRSGLPEDIAGAVAFLASKEASYITGVTLRVDGGLILPGMPEQMTEAHSQRGWGYVKKEFNTED